MVNKIRKQWVVFFAINTAIVLISLIQLILNMQDFTALIKRGYVYGSFIGYCFLLAVFFAASLFWGLNLGLSPKLLAFRDKCLTSSRCVNWVVIAVLAGEVILQTKLLRPLTAPSAGVMLVYTSLGIMSILLLCNTLVFRYWQAENKLADPLIKSWRSVVLVLLITGLVILALQISIQPALSSPYYSGAGAPMVPLQLLLGITCMLLVQAIAAELSTKNKAFLWLDVSVCLALCSLAVFSWRAAPVPINHFMHESKEGSAVLYPFSDSRDYDANAQWMLMGEGLSAGQPLPRPLYVFFIGALHKLVGEDFMSLVNAQTTLYAFFPALAYLFGKRYFNREIGILFALLFIFREENLALLSGIMTQSSNRMLLSEFMTAVWLILTAWAGVAWVRKPNSHSLAVFTGLTLGMTALVRAQVVVMAPLLVVFIVISTFRKKLVPWRKLLCFLVAFMTVVLAWSVRNYVRSGSFAFEDARYTTYLKKLLSLDDAPKLLESAPSETQAIPVGLLANTPALVVNSLYSSLHQFPWQSDPLLTLSENAITQEDGRYFPQLSLSIGGWVLITLHLILVISGVWVAFRRLGWGGLLPLGIYGLYNVSTAAVGFSGWRFVQPVDWVFLLYWAVAIVTIFSRLLRLSSENLFEGAQVGDTFAREWKLFPLVLLISFSAIFLPVGEVLLGLGFRHVDSVDPQAIIQEALPVQVAANLFKLAESPGGFLLSGTLMYPTYLETERDYVQNKLQDEYSGDNQGLSFELFSGNKRQQYYLDGRLNPGTNMHNKEVVVVGCAGERVDHAYGIVLVSDVVQLLVPEGNISETCGTD